MLLLFSISTLLCGALASALLARRPDRASSVFKAALVLGSLSGFASVIAGEWPQAAAAGALPLWRLPAAGLSVRLDALSSFFLSMVLGVCLLAGLYGEGYLAASRTLKNSRSVRPLFLLLTASLAVVVCAHNAVLFLFAWEIMALSSFFLIIAEDEQPQVRRAGLLYFICTHTGTLALFVLFAVLGGGAGTLEFEGMRALVPPSGARSAFILLLAMIGFGMKAGLAPLHVWLQEAHPAAPTHVSAVMSGVVIKTGVYGFLRLIWLLGGVPPFWADALILAGAVSGVGGVLFALGQHDLKRLLAYHSVENIGIIFLGLGLGCLGLSHHRPELALLGFAGAILHTLNHAIFKSLLFLGSGAFYQALGTRDLEAGGGLLKRMPWVCSLSLLGAAAISGLPPLNGFISEWLVYSASASASSISEARLAAVAIGSLALIGGLALACFTKAYGALCLGLPRTEAARHAVEPGPVMLWPMAVLAALCLIIGLWPGPVLVLVSGAAAEVCGASPETADLALAGAVAGARLIGLAGAGFILLAATFALLRAFLLGSRISYGPTWNCAFPAAGSRTQYTASSYAAPLLRVFAPVLGARTEARAPAGFWPESASFSTHCPDRILDGLLLPSAASAVKLLARGKRLQRGRLQYYMLSVALFLLFLLVWKL